MVREAAEWALGRIEERGGKARGEIARRLASTRVDRPYGIQHTDTAPVPVTVRVDVGATATPGQVPGVST